MPALSQFAKASGNKVTLVIQALEGRKARPLDSTSQWERKGWLCPQARPSELKAKGRKTPELVWILAVCLGEVERSCCDVV